MKYRDSFHGPSFSIQNRLKRLVWNAISALFFRYSPRPLFVWRSFLLRCFGAKVEKGVHVYPKVAIWAPWNLELGSHCGIADRVILYSQDKIIIGKRAVISQGAHLVTGTHDYEHPGFPLVTSPIVIESYAWIAADVFIHPGVRIGEGCIIGARSVVSKSMPSWMVCTGHPCIPVKARNKEGIIPNGINK